MNLNLVKSIKRLLTTPIHTPPIPTSSENNCWNCGRKIFNIDTKFGEMGLCVYFHEAYKQGVESITDKYPGQVEIECQKCKNITTCRDKQIDIFRAKSIALCCDNPNYLYYIEEMRV